MYLFGDLSFESIDVHGTSCHSNYKARRIVAALVLRRSVRASNGKHHDQNLMNTALSIGKLSSMMLGKSACDRHVTLPWRTESRFAYRPITTSKFNSLLRPCSLSGTLFNTTTTL